MKTILTIEINGIQIINGYSEPIIDPVKTETIIKPFLENTDIARQIHAKVKEQGQRQRMAIEAVKMAARLKMTGDIKGALAKEQEGQKYYSHVQNLQEELIPLREPLKQRRAELIKEHAEYFEPRQGEYIITNEQYNRLTSKQLDYYHKLGVDGTIYPDYRTAIIYQKINNKWQIITLAFGEELPEGAILEKNLTEEQKQEIIEQAEFDRIVAMSTSEKTLEMDAVINSIAQEAAAMRSGLEIQNDPDALQKSQDWYNEKVSIIKEKYK